MNNRYKLCRVLNWQKSKVQPINEKGEAYGDILLSYEDDDDHYYYAIYENDGDENDEDWNEWGFYDQDFDEALKAYNQLTKKGESNEIL